MLIVIEGKVPLRVKEMSDILIAQDKSIFKTIKNREFPNEVCNFTERELISEIIKLKKEVI